MEFLDHPDENDDVGDLLNWWNWYVFLMCFSKELFEEVDASLNSQVFPSYVTREHGVTKQSALAKLKEKRVLKQIQNAGTS